MDWIINDGDVKHHFYAFKHRAFNFTYSLSLAAVRMATLDAQERVLANKEHVINGVSFTSVKKINKQMSNVLAAY